MARGKHRKSRRRQKNFSVYARRYKLQGFSPALVMAAVLLGIATIGFALKGSGIRVKVEIEP